MAQQIGTRKIPFLADRDPERQQFFEEVKFRLDSIASAGPSNPNTGTSSSSLALIGTGTSATEVFAFRAVTTNSVGGLIHASSDIAGHADQVLGVAISGGPVNSQVDFIQAGEVENPAWMFTPEEPVYLGLDGQVTHDPDTGLFRVQIGYAKTATKINVRISYPIQDQGQEVFIGIPSQLPSGPAIVFEEVVIGGQTKYKMKVSDGAI